jgi:radical SAM protein with 4Fe4S-binding SPASM domain
MQQISGKHPINSQGRLEPSLATYLLLSVTKRCNLRCTGCYFLQQQEAFFQNSELPLEQAKEIVDYYHLLGVPQVVPDAEGEALLYRDYPALLSYISSKGFKYKPWLVTNGTLLKRNIDLIFASIREILISVDGHDASSYNAFRGGNHALFDKVIGGVEALVARGRGQRIRPVIILNHVTTRDRLDELRKMIVLAERLGVDAIKFSNFHSIGEEMDYRPLYLTDSEVMREIEHIVSRCDYRVGILLPNLFGRQQPPFSCRMLASVVIGANGDFAPCCRIMPEGRWGNFFSSGLRHNNEALCQFRKQVLHAKSVAELPMECRECSHLSPVRGVYQPHLQQWRRSNIS